VRVALDIICKDIRGALRDRSAIVISVLAPLILIVVLSLLMKGPDVRDQKVAYVRPAAPSAIDTLLRTQVLPALERGRVLTVTSYPNRAAAARAVKNGKRDVGIVAAPGTVEIVRSPDAPIAALIAESAVSRAAQLVDATGSVLGAERRLGRVSGDVLREDQEVGAKLAAVPPAFAVADAPDTGGLSEKTLLASGMMTFFLFFTTQFGLLGVLAERRQGTLARILAAPVTRRQVLFAKVGTSYVLGVIAMTTLALTSWLLLGAAFGNPVGVAILIACGGAAATGTTALILGLVKTAEQASSAMAAVALVLGLLGGSFFSMSRGGGIGATVTQLTPHHWFMEGLTRLNEQGGTIASVAGPAGIMLLFALVVGVPGIVLARRAVRP